jgi:hypothetical protein
LLSFCLMKLFLNSITINITNNTLRKKKGGLMLLPAAILASALTACPQPPAPQEPTQVEARALTSRRDIMLHGIVAGTSFNTNQNLTLNNASVFANAALVLNSRSLSLNGNIISSTSAATCTDNSGQGLCINGKPKFVNALVNVPKPDLAALKTKYNTATSTTVQSSLNLNSSSDISAKFDNQMILVKGSLNLNALGTIKNALIVVTETLKSNQGLKLENTRIIAKEAQFNQTTTLNNSRILTDEDLTFNGKLEGTGLSSVMTAKNFTSNGTGISAVSGELAVIANQNLTLNQVSSGKLMLWAGGNITVNQGLNLEGAMVAGGKVVLNSSVSVTKVSSHLNADVPGGGGGREYATVQDGGSVTFSNGVTVSVLPGSRTKPLDLYMEEVPASANWSPVPDAYVPISPYYRIGTTGKDTSAGNPGGFIVGLPAPTGENPDNIGTIFQIPQKESFDTDWTGGIDGEVNNGKVLSSPLSFYNAGSVFVIIKRKVKTSLSSKVTEDRAIRQNIQSPLKINCSICASGVADKLLNLLNNSYFHWIDIMQLSQKEYPLFRDTKIQCHHSFLR